MICVIIYLRLDCLCLFFRVTRRFLGFVGLVGDECLLIFLNVLLGGLSLIFIRLSISIVLAISRRMLFNAGLRRFPPPRDMDPSVSVGVEWVEWGEWVESTLDDRLDMSDKWRDSFEPFGDIFSFNKSFVALISSFNKVAKCPAGISPIPCSSINASFNPSSVLAKLPQLSSECPDESVLPDESVPNETSKIGPNNWLSSIYIVPIIFLG